MKKHKKKKASTREKVINVLLVIFVALLIFPKTRMPIISTIQRVFASSPSEISDGKQIKDTSWPLKNMNGETVAFNQTEDQVKVVNFWATWCPPCVAEMPYFQDLYNAYEKKVNFYFITSEEPEVVGEFMKKHDYKLPVYFQKYTAPEVLQSQALPTTFIIGKDGVIHVKKKGAARWNSRKTKTILDKLIAE